MKGSLDITPINEWLDGYNKPLIISGPCSAENEEQVISTAKELKKTGKVDMLRAGIWKPRTRPNSFEGVGELGLEWLNNAKKETGFPITTEVANSNHVELCLKHNVDVLWIGARTTVNPFSVQDIADSLKGVDIPVFVKNPINPDLQLWIGAMERLNQAGIKKIAAIHRGFSSFEKTPFRNAPKWEIAIELKRLYPELDIICDPSHIAGTRELIGMVSQKALDMDMMGLMIESHIQPSIALSDAKQQVTPSALGLIIDELIVRSSTTKDENFKSHLDQLRDIIDELDEEIIHRLSMRMETSKRIGEYKRDNDVTILQVNRWEEIIGSRLNMGTTLGLSEEFMKKLLQLIHKESISNQTAIMNIKSIIEK